MKRANCYFRQGHIYMAPQNVTVSGFGITGEPYRAVSVDTDTPDVIGNTLQGILDASKEGVPDPGKGKTLAVELYRLAGVRSYRTFSEGTLLCTVYVDNENAIHFVPERNVGPKEGYIPISDSEIVLAHDSTASEIGTALLSAFEKAE